ncbi:transposase [Latilactobacillus sakei]|nr:transposase [Latilactobacillus sakei]
MAIKYSNEFKESIVSLSQTGRSANSLAKEYNVSVSTVTKWIKQADPNNTKVLSSWIDDYNFSRIKTKLGCKSPVEYRIFTTQKAA